MESLAAYVVTGVVSLAVGMVLMYLQPKAKLVYWSPHYSVFQVKENLWIQTNSVTVQNTGRRVADDVEVIMSRQPNHLQIQPAIPYTTEITKDGNFVLQVAHLGPKELFTLQLLDFTQGSWLLNVRSTAGHAKPMPFQVQRVYPNWINVLVAILLTVGFGFSVYWIVRALVFLSRSIGIV
jgi:hypothetical protein